jgi:indole-3-glycerol phosphate synthase
MSEFLRMMQHASVERVAQAQLREPLAELRQRVSDAPRREPFRWDDTQFGLIAEIKPISPAKGVLIPPGTALLPFAERRAREYERGGARLISVLTEPLRFGGSLELLAALAAKSSLPIMRKDFIVDRYQIYEARVHGAAGVLLIARLLSDEQLDEFCGLGAELGLFVLLEAFDQSDLVRCLSRVTREDRSRWIGVNARDLETLQVDRQRFEALASALHQAPVRIAESSLERPEDLRSMVRLGFNGALVGEVLMRSNDPAALIGAMCRAAAGLL